MRKNIFGFLVVVSLLLVACTGAVNTPEQQMEQSPVPEMTEELEMETEATATLSEVDSMSMDMETSEGQESEMEISKTESAMMEEDKAVNLPEWFSVRLTDVRNGQDFRIEDFKGKVVLVETMAIWCSTCLRQQKQVKLLHEMIGERDDFVSVGLDIDLYEDAEMLKNYIQEQGFGWLYAIAPEKVSRHISELYGDQYLNPPSAPMFIIDRHGEVHLLPFGIKDASFLFDSLQQFLDEGI